MFLCGVEHVVEDVLLRKSWDIQGLRGRGEIMLRGFLEVLVPDVLRLQRGSCRGERVCSRTLCPRQLRLSQQRREHLEWKGEGGLLLRLLKER